MTISFDFNNETIKLQSRDKQTSTATSSDFNGNTKK